MKEVSILFAKEAEELLAKGDTAAAINLCNTGIEVYAEYPMGYLVLAECCFEMEDIEKALQTVTIGISKFPQYTPLAEFKRLLEDTAVIADVANELDDKLSSMNSEIDSSNGSIESSGTELEEDISESSKESSKPENNNFLKLVTSFESSEHEDDELRTDNLSLIPGLSYSPLRATRKMNSGSHVKQSLNFPEFYNPYNIEEDSAQLESTEDYYTTETIAAILEKQGAYQEAANAYIKLKELHPEKTDIFDKKIAELSLKK